MRNSGILRTYLLIPAVAALLHPSIAWSAPDPVQILVRSIRQTRGAYSGEQVTVTANGREQVQKVYRKDTTLRIDFPDGRVFFDDGTNEYVYVPRQSIVEKGETAFTARRIDNEARAIERGKRFVITQQGEDAIAGRQAYVLTVQGTGPRQQVRKIWVDKQTYVQLRQDIQQENGKSTSTYFRTIDYHAPSAEQLQFSPPPGAPIVEKGHGRPVPSAQAADLAKQWGGLLEPKYVPAGYRFQGYYHHVYNGQPLLVAVYASPKHKQTFSFFQGPSLGMSQLHEHKPGNLRVLGQRKGAADVIVVGPLPEDDLRRVMDSVP